MADTTTELEVLNDIVDLLGGTSGQHETVVPTLRQILALLGGGNGGYNPSISVGRADALTGADETTQWATRESTGTGSATVRSVQGAAVGWNQLVQVGGTINDTGLELTQNQDGSITLNGTTIQAGSCHVSVTIALTAHKYLIKGCPSGGSLSTFWLGFQTSAGDTGGGYIYTRNNDNALSMRFYVAASGLVFDNVTLYPQLFDLTAMFGSGNEPTTVAEFEQMFPAAYYPYSAPTLKPVQIAGIQSTDANGDALDAVSWETRTLRAAGSVRDELYSDHVDVKVGERAYQSGDESDATVRTDGTTTYYPLETPTTTPISPALPMTYKVQQGGSESIIVPEGEISAAPILTIAEGESAGELVMDALACIAAPDGPTATANHAVNTYLTMGGKLYKVTTAIAAGETIAAGTNVSQTTVMSELLALTA